MPTSYVCPCSVPCRLSVLPVVYKLIILTIRQCVFSEALGSRFICDCFFLKTIPLNFSRHRLSGSSIFYLSSSRVPENPIQYPDAYIICQDTISYFTSTSILSDLRLQSRAVEAFVPLADHDRVSPYKRTWTRQRSTRQSFTRRVSSYFNPKIRYLTRIFRAGRAERGITDLDFRGANPAPDPASA